MFTCETRGSTVLAWTSDEYIEAGGNEFATFNNVGDTHTSPVNHNTVALINKTSEWSCCAGVYTSYQSTVRVSGFTSDLHTC